MAFTNLREKKPRNASSSYNSIFPIFLLLDLLHSQETYSNTNDTFQQNPVETMFHCTNVYQRKDEFSIEILHCIMIINDQR